MNDIDERMREAFSNMHASDELKKATMLRVERELGLASNRRDCAPCGQGSAPSARRVPRKRRMRVFAAVAACLIVTAGTGTAYASDLGGIQRKVQLWIHGDQTDAQF